jgi:hypothetical protein
VEQPCGEPASTTGQNKGAGIIAATVAATVGAVSFALVGPDASRGSATRSPALRIRRRGVGQVPVVRAETLCGLLHGEHVDGGRIVRRGAFSVCYG